MSERSDRQFVEAFARGLALLQALSRQDRPLTNGELARATGLPLSTVSRLTYTATSLGFVRPSAGRRGYELTPKSLALGYPVLAGLPGLDIVRPVLKRISEVTGETAGFVIRDRLHVTFVEVSPGSRPDAVPLAAGGRLPIAVSAGGLALLTALPPAQRRTVVARLRAELSRRGKDPEELDRTLGEAVAGQAVSVRDAWRRGISGIARGLQFGGDAAAVTIAIGTQHFRPETRPLLEAALAEAVDGLDAHGRQGPPIP